MLVDFIILYFSLSLHSHSFFLFPFVSHPFVPPLPPFPPPLPPSPTPSLSHRTLTGSRQRSMCLSKPPIIPFSSDCTPVFRLRAGEKEGKEREGRKEREGGREREGACMATGKSEYINLFLFLFLSYLSLPSPLLLPPRLFFVIECVNGGDMMFHMQRHRRLPEEHARFYSAEISLALNFLHDRGACVCVCA